MTRVEQLLRQTLTGLADQGQVPSMGERALAGARRRHRRRVVASGMITIVVVLAIAAASVLLSPGTRRSTGPISPPTGESGRIEVPGAAVDYYQDAMNVQQSWWFNPESGRYEVVKRILRAVSPDLWYAIVAPCEPPDPSCDSYAWYNLATGDVQELGIFGTPAGFTVDPDLIQYNSGDLSPDSSTYVFAGMRVDNQDFAHIDRFRLVDMRTAEQHSVSLEEPDGWTAQDLVGWTADGQYLIVVARAAGTHGSLGADLLYRPDGSMAALHVWPPGGATEQVKQILGTNLIARMPAGGVDEPVEIRDVTTEAVIATYSHEQMLRTG
ncbi:MAG TPA: hypothetical protein VKE25_15765, partial [Actinomycetes bacterium]|nr:hypothetical protein [Actinomycetes bacterium]